MWNDNAIELRNGVSDGATDIAIGFYAFSNPFH